MNRFWQGLAVTAGLSLLAGLAGAADWDANRTYQKDDTVSHQGRNWQAQWWNRNEVPGKAAGAWAEILPEGQLAWLSTRAYTSGAEVDYAGKRYRARWWTQGEEPGQREVWLLLGDAEPVITGLAAVRSAGRVLRDGEQLAYSWPGVYFDGRFRGGSIGLQFDDAQNRFDVLIDGKVVQEVVNPGKSTVWINGLLAGEHRIRVAKRTESTQSSGRFLGFVAGTGSKLLTPPPAAKRQIEYIGDSLTVGYGNSSGKRECTEAEISATTNANLSFGALAAAKFGADYQLNAYSGLGMIRNYDGNLYPTNYRSYYPRTLLNDSASVWQNDGSWKPQLVVIGLGANDFNTPVKPGEPWTTASRKAGYKESYHAFLDQLRQQYGKDAQLVLSATSLWQADDFIPAVQEIAAERRAAGDSKVVALVYGGLDFMGCQWHPSLADHQRIADQLGDVVKQTNLGW
ncbi:carbohydrate-binding protein [Chitinilyticum piscinae]|uniref:Acetylxylan esterase n=1 Tax=Chitinilyticum piscinae TaxID=2866724 RepID=A0A8J7KD05_9NEIS|nr:carbohydrate-binding protein [Chitinilyticum piscinae]MBE9608289.1 acetylxylan esterase [Chitinilyticum piscinae]